MLDPVLFFLAVATILGTPGPTNTLLATAGSVSGIARSLHLLVAEVAGYSLAIATIRFALAPLLREQPVIASGLKVLVAVYLVWLAIKLWRRSRTLVPGERPVSFTNVFITTLFNPKALIFALSVLPLNHPNLHWYVVAFVAMVPAAGLGWILLGALLGRAAGERSMLLPRVASAALLGFAGLIVSSAVTG